MKDKSPFSPFVNGGIEVKATCGILHTNKELLKRGVVKPDIGDNRISNLKSFVWKSHHRQTIMNHIYPLCEQEMINDGVNF